MEGFWKLHVTVVIPHDEAPTLDDAIDMVGDKLRPLAWAGRVNEEENDGESPV